MTVAQLITALQQQQGNSEVVVSRHSQFALVTGVGTISGFDNGGYISLPFRAIEQDKSKTYVYLEDN